MTAREALQAPSRPVHKGALSSGSTLLNLACSDQPTYAFLKGGYYYLVGDTSSGKTFTSLTCFAEACQNPAFDKYRLIFDDVEGGALMDMAYFFGKQVAKRLEPPARSKKGRPLHSSTIEDFYYHVQTLLDDRRPFIYVLDSQDALDSKAATSKFRQQKKAAESGQDAAGSYGDGKAKYHSEHLRHVLAGIRRSGSILIIIGQTRDNLSMSFEPKTRSGGRALRFYANLEIWTSVGKKIKKKVRDMKRTVGVICLAEIKKNRLTGKVGKDRQVEIPIYYNLGIDDIGSCVDFLIRNKHWKAAGKGVFDAHDVMVEGTRTEIIKHIEEEDLTDKLRQITAKVWQEVEEESLPNRKRRYE